MNQNTNLKQLVNTLSSVLPDSVPFDIKKWKQYWEIRFNFDFNGDYIDLPMIFGVATNSGHKVSMDMSSEDVMGIIIKPKDMVNFN